MDHRPKYKTQNQKLGKTKKSICAALEYAKISQTDFKEHKQ